MSILNIFTNEFCDTIVTQMINK